MCRVPQMFPERGDLPCNATSKFNYTQSHSKLVASRNQQRRTMLSNTLKQWSKDRPALGFDEHVSSSRVPLAAVSRMLL
jgi:hypothetical protein